MALGSIVGLLQTEASHVDVEFMDVFFGNRFVIDPLLVGPVDDLVIDVRKVADIGHVISAVSEIAVDRVEDDGRPGMADVGEIVDRDPADIHPDLFLLEGNKFFFLAGQCVVDAKCHEVTLMQSYLMTRFRGH